ncbi:MAG: DUF1554 domain-containing protein [Deltaproteobacteria bacterium]|nr:DUF1554 domain-containing protein [Deltaproteobacteria bacterium]
MRTLLTHLSLVALLAACGGEDMSGPEPDPLPREGLDAGDPGPSKVIFVTSTRHDGDLGGFEGADAICAERASAAGLTGTFRAWLSSGTVNAADRLEQSTGPYVRTDGVQIASDWADLIDANIAAPINRDENGNSQSGDVWTGTYSSGVMAPDTCSGFMITGGSGMCGNSNATNLQWTDNLVPGCTTMLRLYCIEQ